MNPLAMEKELAEESISSVQETMNAIKSFNCNPSVFKVFLEASDQLDGFNAWVDFRSYGDCSSVSAHGETPEEALLKLYNTLVSRFGICPTCGGTGKVNHV